ncbi:MAG: Rieske 2Fe-2S domain-containing protein [Holophaga sp.]|nr:Rieske 2Fe-2S domain-containing protein [Holophaga sp.]
MADGEFGAVITAGKEADFPAGSVTHIPNGRFYIVRLADGGFLAVYQRCTHLGCNVPWDQTAGAFICPCHSSQFTTEGAVQTRHGQPRSISSMFKFSTVWSTWTPSRPVQRQAFETSQVVYP